MSLINFNEPKSFCETVEAVAIVLQICLAKFRDEAAFRDDDDEGRTLRAAHFLIDMLEDTHKEAEILAETLEARLRLTPRGRGNAPSSFQ